MKNQSIKAIPRYAIVSPVKDEEINVERTLKSVVNQKIKPVSWIIVDDGSRDNSRDIIRCYLANNPFIKLVENPSAGERRPGANVIRAFKYGYEQLADTEYDLVVKLDCDLSFDKDYFEGLLNKFIEDTNLGIASGVYYEQNHSVAWSAIAMPSYHAAGACKVMRRQCFEEIGGFITSAGWDTVDEIRAMAIGRKTRHFKELHMKHHKPEGSGIGLMKTSVMHGEIFYLTGGSVLFLIFKVLHRFTVKPYILNAMALLRGYLNARRKRKTLLVTDTESSKYKAILNARLVDKAKRVLSLN